ncbi:serine/threonine protein kinase [Barrientosiimonas humi]|uniref:non-specific serine/threonine protein kinase n=1 Tax=Barrientosiimonas humi TaxID=999931 RepID=A0A542X8H3_9MICO|nr:serine/threonine protein kinase [Barrientosiimonas humi]CAG7572113.1 Serine/threonine-protein kinase PknH [Barrientosiimonas humi]
MTRVEGEVVGGNRLTGVAGRGAMGVVYLADQLALNRRVAVKVVNPALAEDPEFRARFQHEARMAAALEHPHIVPVYAAGEDRGRLYLTMRYVEGTDLATALRRDGPMPPALAVEVVEQIGSALDAAHARGLVHRDVKPANVMLTWSEGRPHAYLTDFGISKLVGAAGPTRTGMALGTLDYMAPELLVGDPYDGRADLYALGAVLFQALTGRVPFPRGTDAARMYAHLHDPVPEDERVPPALMSVVRRAMAKQPAERYGTARELAAAARAALGGRPETGAPAPGSATSYERVGGVGQPRQDQPRRAVLLGGAAGLLAAAGVGGALWWQSREEGDPTVRSAGSGSPTSEATLPATEPAGRVLPTSKVYSVGPKPQDLQEVSGYFFSLNRGDNSLSCILQDSETVKTYQLDAEPLYLLEGRRKVWCVNAFHEMIPIDLQTMAVGQAVPMPMKTSYDGTSDGDRWGWIASAPAGIYRFDLETGEKDLDVRVPAGAVINRVAVMDSRVYGLDIRKRLLHRYNAADGSLAGDPVQVPEGSFVVAELGKQLIVGGGKAGARVLRGDQLVTPAIFRDTSDVNAIIGDDFSVWVAFTSNKEIRRARMDLSGWIGAPVRGVPFGPRFMAGLGSGQLLVLDEGTSKVTTVTITPLR